MITAKKLSTFTLGRRMYESPRKYAAAVAHPCHYYLAVLGTTTKEHLFQTIHLKLRPVFDFQQQYETDGLGIYSGGAKYFIE